MSNVKGLLYWRFGTTASSCVMLSVLPTIVVAILMSQMANRILNKAQEY